MDYNDLRNAYRLEKNSARLSPLDQGFFADLRAFVKTEQDAYLKAVKKGALAKARDFANLKKLVEEFLALREKKLLNKALVCAHTREADLENVAEEEKSTFKAILKALGDFTLETQAWFGEESQGEEFNTVSLKVRKEVPRFVGTDLKEYGPFTEGAQVELPEKISELLEKRGLVERAD